MDKKHTVKKNEEFRIIIKKGIHKNHPYFTVYKYINNKNINYRFGISISKKLGNAVVRNRQKRIIREIINEYKNIYQKNEDYIIIIRKDFISASFEEKKAAFLKLINKLKQEHK